MPYRYLAIIVCLFVGAMQPIAPVYAQTADVSGYGLFRNTSAGWAWAHVDGVSLSTSIRQESGLLRLKFTVVGNVPIELNLEKARFGIVTGNIGMPANVWFTAQKAYASDASAQSPWSAELIAQAALQSASVHRDQGGMSIELAFDSVPQLLSPWDLYVLIDADGNADSGFNGGEYLIQNTKMTGNNASDLTIAGLDIRPGILKLGEKTKITVIVYNATDKSIADASVGLVLPKGFKSIGSLDQRLSLRPKESKHIIWNLSAREIGSFRIRVQVDAGDSHARQAQWISVVNKRDPKHEFQTEIGAWAPYPARPTLQVGNSAKLSEFVSLPSSKLKHNLFGITAHIPRSTNEEDPFIAPNAVDGDPSTCWGSRWWRTSIPSEPEWVETDLGREVVVSEVRFLPAWKNSGMPAALKIEVSKDAKQWDAVFDDLDYRPQVAPEGDAKRRGDLTWQCFPVGAHTIRYVRLEASRLNQGNTSFFCAPMEPFQFRVGEIVVVDSVGNALTSFNKRAKSSSVHTAWYNSSDATKKTWPLMLSSGVKLNRISQWGDKTDWATVEKVKGVYKIDPEVDRYITESVNSGIDILLTLDYGNNLYQQVLDPSDFGPTWHKGHPFLQCAPTTPEAVQGFANYCAFMARHFRGRVKYFEVWNEENGWFFNEWATRDKVSAVQAYGKALAAAAKAVKEANPDAMVCFGGTAGTTLDYYQIALDEGAGPYIDLVAFHPYGHAVPEEAASSYLTAVDDKMEWKSRPAEITDYDSEIAAIRKLVRKYNPNIEIWADEMNWFAPGDPPKPEMGDMSELTQAKHLARFYSMNAWLGCGAVWWSLYNSNGIQEWALIRSSDMTPRAAYYSAGYISTVLDAAKGAADIETEAIGSAPSDLIVKAYRNDVGQIIVGLWRKSPGSDACEPTAVTLRVSKTQVASADLVDSLYGYSQDATFSRDGDSAVFGDLLVGDWPLYLRINPAK
ncbi:MAG: discoidin domain-containing protein [Armatimonadota bacterium]